MLGIQKNWSDKFKLWFMPTGWRPVDVAQRFPKQGVDDVYALEKYAPVYSLKHKITAVFHFVSLNAFIYVFLSSFGTLSFFSQMAFALLIFTTIFGFTSLMDGHRWAFVFEIIRSVVGLFIFFHPSQAAIWSTDLVFAGASTLYFALAFGATIWIGQSLPQRSLIPS